MRILNSTETMMAFGGICEGLTFQECLASSPEFIEKFGHAITRNEFIQMLNELGGDMGIWLYNITHDD